MNNVWKIIEEEINDLVKIMIKQITIILFFFFFSISILVVLSDFSKTTSIIVLTISFLFLGILIFLNDKFKKVKKYKYKPAKRFTQKNEVGDISIDESRIHQAIIYLSILEDEIW